MQLNFIHIISIVITLIMSLGLGIYSGKKVKSADDFALGGRNSGISMVAGSLIGTIVGGSATVGTAQMAFHLGFSAIWFTMGCGLSLIIMALLYAAKLRSTGLSTIPEFLVVNFNKNAGPLSSISSSFGIFFSIVASLLTSIHLISGLFGLSSELSGLLMLVTVVLTVIFGGMGGSGVTGLFKVFLIIIALCTGGVYAYIDLGYIAGIQSTFPAIPWLSLGGNSWSENLTSFACLVVGIITTQTYAQAIFSASNNKTAMLGTLAAGLFTLPIGIPSVLIGMYMKTIHPDIEAIQALPIFLLNYMPSWLGGIGISAILLSAVGSTAGLALGVGTMLSRDIFQEVFKVHDNKKLLLINRLCVFVITILSLLFVFANMDSLVFVWNYLSMALRGAGIFVPFTIAIFWKGKLSARFGIYSMISGIFVSLLGKMIVPSITNTLLPALAVSFLIACLGLIFDKPNPKILTKR